MRGLPAVPKFTMRGVHGPRVAMLAEPAQQRDRRIDLADAGVEDVDARVSNRPAPSAGSAMTTRIRGASAAIANDGARRLAEAAEVLRDAEVDQDARVQDSKAGVGRKLGRGAERAAGREHVVHEDEPALPRCISRIPSPYSSE